MTRTLQIVLIPWIAALANGDDVISVRAGHRYAVSGNAGFLDLAEHIARDHEGSCPLPLFGSIDRPAGIVVSIQIELALRITTSSAFVLLAIQGATEAGLR